MDTHLHPDLLQHTFLAFEFSAILIFCIGILLLAIFRKKSLKNVLQWLFVVTSGIICGGYAGITFEVYTGIDIGANLSTSLALAGGGLGFIIAQRNKLFRPKDFLYILCIGFISMAIQRAGCLILGCCTGISTSGDWGISHVSETGLYHPVSLYFILLFLALAGLSLLLTFVSIRSKTKYLIIAILSSAGLLSVSYFRENINMLLVILPITIYLSYYSLYPCINRNYKLKSGSQLPFLFFASIFILSAPVLKGGETSILFLLFTGSFLYDLKYIRRRALAMLGVPIFIAITPFISRDSVPELLNSDSVHRSQKAVADSRNEHELSFFSMNDDLTSFIQGPCLSRGCLGECEEFEKLRSERLIRVGANYSITFGVNKKDNNFFMDFGGQYISHSISSLNFPNKNEQFTQIRPHIGVGIKGRHYSFAVGIMPIPDNVVKLEGNANYFDDFFYPIPYNLSDEGIGYIGQYVYLDAAYKNDGVVNEIGIIAGNKYDAVYLNDFALRIRFRLGNSYSKNKFFLEPRLSFSRYMDVLSLKATYLIDSETDFYLSGEFNHAFENDYPSARYLDVGLGFRF